MLSISKSHKISTIRSMQETDWEDRHLRPPVNYIVCLGNRFCAQAIVDHGSSRAGLGRVTVVSERRFEPWVNRPFYFRFDRL